MNMGEFIKAQARLTQVQIYMSNIIEKEADKDPELRDVALKAKHEVIGDILKLTIPEYPPKINIYNKVQIINGSFISGPYQEARDRWYSLIRKGLEGYEGGRIVPAIVYLVHYVPGMCDVGNFAGKAIVDGLMYFGAIGTDDNLKQVPVEIQEARLDKDNPRTEIYIIKYTNQIEEILTPYKKEEKEEKEIEKYKKKIEDLEKEITILREAKRKEEMFVIEEKNDSISF